MHLHPVQVLLPLTLLLAAAGCAGTPKSAADTAEYDYVTPLGSNIAVRVPKGQKTAPNSTSPTGTMSAEQLGTMINAAGGKVPVDKGGD